MHSEIVGTAHIPVHHEFQRKRRTFARLKGHRTDSRHRRSAAIQDFNIWGLAEAQGLITRIIQFKRHFDRLA